MNTPGICYLVGAGPGDPGLVTLRAKDLVGRADVLVYDALSSPVILGWARKDCRRRSMR
jgi:uroporphyrinogen III methyltransferase/synthase